MTTTFVQDIWGYTLVLPWLVLLAFAVHWSTDRAGRFGKQLITLLYGFWLTIVIAFLYILKSKFNTLRSDPYNVDVIEWAYPCDVAFYTAAASTYVITYSIIWRRQLPAMYWAFFIIFCVTPPAILVFFQYNVWWEVLISAAIGIIITVFYLSVVKTFMPADYITVMMMLPIFKMFMANDSHIRTTDEFDNAVEVIEPAIEEAHKVMASMDTTKVVCFK